MRKFVLLGLLFFQPLSALDFNHHFASEHMEIACTENDAQISADLLQQSEQVYEKCAEEFQHQLTHQLQIFIFPDIQSFHDAIDQKEAPDSLICTLKSPIQLVSPLNPGTYHSSENVKKALFKGIAQAFIYDKFQEMNAPWWLVAGITAKKVDWPYTRHSGTLPGINELEHAHYGEPGMGWCALSLVTYIEEKCGWKAVLSLLEDYTRFEQVIGISKEQLVDEWQASLQ